MANAHVKSSQLSAAVHEVSVLPGSVPALPEEVLELILGHLDPDSPPDPDDQTHHRTTLVALCATSKQWLRLARPWLYRTLQLGDMAMASRTLASSPSLARLVKRVTAEEWDIPSHYHPERVALERAECSVGKDPLPRYRKALAGFEFDGLLDAEAILEKLEHGSQDAHLTFILTQCHDLEMLSTVLPCWFGESMTITYLARAPGLASSPHPPQTTGHPTGLKGHLTQLRELRLQHWDTEGSFHIKEIDEILCFPNLESFYGWEVSIEGEDYGHTQGPLPGLSQGPLPQMPNLRTFHVEEATANATGIARLLRSCPQLTTLAIQLGEPASLYGESDIDYEQIGTVLCELAPQLESLSISYSHNVGVCADTQDDWEHSAFRSLRPLTALKRVDVPAYPVFGDCVRHPETPAEAFARRIFDILPESVEELSINAWNAPLGPARDFDAAVQAALEATMTAVLPRLRKVTVKGEMGERHMQPFHARLLWDRGSEEGKGVVRSEMVFPCEGCIDGSPVPCPLGREGS